MIKQTIRTYLLASHSDADLKTWFDPLDLRFVPEAGLEVRFPHALFASWFAGEHRSTLEKEIPLVCEEIQHIRFVAPSASSKRLRFPAAPQQTASPPVRLPVLPDAEKYSRFTFINFMYNRKNEFPVSMAMEVAKKPDSPEYNPFILCGKGTCGKTHLLRAISRAMAGRLLQEHRMYFGSVEDFAALHADKSQYTRDFATHCTAFFLDDAHLLGKYPVLQQEVALLADTFREQKKPLVLALDGSLRQAGFSDKLRSRLESGLVVTLKKPDLDIRLRYAKEKAEQAQLFLKKEHLLLLTQSIYDFRQLDGLLTKITAYQEKMKRALTDTDLEKILHNTDTPANRLLTPDTIVSLVAEYFSLPIADILGSGRQKDAVSARQISMYLCRELLGVSLAAVGSFFGRKNHATVLYACKKVSKQHDSNKTTNKMVTELRKKCLNAGV